MQGCVHKWVTVVIMTMEIRNDMVAEWAEREVRMIKLKIEHMKLNPSAVNKKIK